VGTITRADESERNLLEKIVCSLNSALKKFFCRSRSSTETSTTPGSYNSKGDSSFSIARFYSRDGKLQSWWAIVLQSLASTLIKHT